MEDFPEVNLTRNVFVADEKHITASGGTATADLMLHLIERDHGYDLSVAVADQMVYNAVRNATSAQRVSLQSRNGMRNAHLARALELMRDNLDEPIPPSNIARKWSAPMGWSSLNVNAWSASGLSGSCFLARAGGSAARYAV